jgi:hypothetical protein
MAPHHNGSHLELLSLDVAAQTDEDTASFWQEAHTTWDINYSGTIRGAGAAISWAPQPGIEVLSKPSRWFAGELPIPWYAYPPPSLEAITADVANDVVNASTWATVKE